MDRTWRKSIYDAMRYDWGLLRATTSHACALLSWNFLSMWLIKLKIDQTHDDDGCGGAFFVRLAVCFKVKALLDKSRKMT
jgi:hypothetical protein